MATTITTPPKNRNAVTPKMDKQQIKANDKEPLSVVDSDKILFEEDISNRQDSTKEEDERRFSELCGKLGYQMDVSNGRVIMKSNDGKAVPVNATNCKVSYMFRDMVPLTWEDIKRGSILFAEYEQVLFDEHHKRYKLDDPSNWISVLLHNRPRPSSRLEIHLPEVSVPICIYKGERVVKKYLPRGREVVSYENDVETKTLEFPLEESFVAVNGRLPTRHVLPKAVVKRIFLVKDLALKRDPKYFVNPMNMSRSVSYSSFLSVDTNRGAVDTVVCESKRPKALWENPGEVELLENYDIARFYGVILCFEEYGQRGITQNKEIDASVFEELFSGVPTWEG